MVSMKPSLRQKYLSIHIPKTAGVSIRNILKEHYGPGFVQHYWQGTDAWGQILKEVPADAICLHGHYQAAQLTHIFPEAALIPWVRDPVERVVSSYFHRLRAPDWRHPVCHEMHSRKLSLAEYAALPLVRNEITHYFGSKKPEDFLFIGIVEEFDQSLARMAALLDIPAARSRRDNVNPEKQKRHYEFPLAVRREIQQLNEQDLRLYEACLRRWGNK